MSKALQIPKKMPDSQKNRGFQCKQMHVIFNRMNEEVWITEEKF